MHRLGRSLILVLFCVAFGFALETKPIVVHGILDLRDHPEIALKGFALRGEWAFYWNQFAIPQTTSGYPGEGN